MNTTNLNGIIITDGMQKVLKEWQNSGGNSIKSDPERYVEYMNDIQDFLIRIMMTEELDEKTKIGGLLEKAVSIKDDLKHFIIAKGGEA